MSLAAAQMLLRSKKIRSKIGLLALVPVVVVWCALIMVAAGDIKERRHDQGAHFVSQAQHRMSTAPLHSTASEWRPMAAAPE